MIQPDNILPSTTYNEELTKWYMTQVTTVASAWLDKEYYESRITPEVLDKWYAQIDSGKVIQDWYDNVYLPSLPPPPAELPIRERTTFVKALEDAFWESGGPDILIKLAKDNPLEFLKICAKLIPADLNPNAAKGNLAITFNITDAKPAIEKVVNTYDQ